MVTYDFLITPQPLYTIFHYQTQLNLCWNIISYYLLAAFALRLLHIFVPNIKRTDYLYKYYVYIVSDKHDDNTRQNGVQMS